VLIYDLCLPNYNNWRLQLDVRSAAGDEICRGRWDIPWEAGAGDRSGGVRRVAERKTHLEAEDTLEGGRCIRRRKMHRKAEEASEAEAKFEMERRGGRGFPLQVWLWSFSGFITGLPNTMENLKWVMSGWWAGNEWAIVHGLPLSNFYLILSINGTLDLGHFLMYKSCFLFILLLNLSCLLFRFWYLFWKAVQLYCRQSRSYVDKKGALHLNYCFDSKWPLLLVYL